MIVDKMKYAKDFTDNEKNISKFVLKNLEQIPNMSAEELGKLTYTSKATVVRFSQKLGLSGFYEFKLHLIAELNQNSRVNNLLANEPITDSSTYEDIINTVPILYDKVLTNTKLSFNKNTMQRINNFLLHADGIEIYGTGISYYLAQAAAFKIETLGFDCSAYESINTYALAAKHKKKTLSLVISFTGSNQTAKQIAKYLKKASNNYVIGILGPHNEAIKECCDDIIEIPNRDSILSLDVINSFIAANYVLDCLFAMILSSNYHEHINSSLKLLQYSSLIFENIDDESE
ncbi:MurR/RpiR family transcriptional regulator [Enterococcus faecalis]|uniref:MurR/RpiR family transcriptional regulator n=1 Tax=Enterococcus TaxID=1350 RepID=UPI001928BBA8|nr:MurR/RpiR family transcriptional regulator [Enterococcus faecalis]MDN3139615.1 MurR/RpiR family transcriptional regulator [Enterococcus faecalis]